MSPHPGTGCTETDAYIGYKSGKRLRVLYPDLLLEFWGLLCHGVLVSIQLHCVWDHCVDCRQCATSLSSASFCHILSHSLSCICFCFFLILQSIN